MRWMSDASFSETKHSNFYKINSLSDATQYSDPKEQLEYLKSFFNFSSVALNFANLSESARLYLHNDTFLLNTNAIKKKLVYPKKFDRVFHIAIDSDDWIIDNSKNNLSDLQQAIEQNLLVKFGTQYKKPTTNKNDPQLEQYFVVVEPFNHEPVKNKSINIPSSYYTNVLESDEASIVDSWQEASVTATGREAARNY